MSIKIFISYANEDYLRVEPYYNQLKDSGFLPWMDKKELIGGEEWEPKLRSELSQADAILYFLSKKTNRNDRYFHVELLHGEKAGNNVLKVPVCLEKCPIPTNLRKFHCIDIYEQDGFLNLLKAINSIAYCKPAVTFDRQYDISINGCKLDLPCYFPSVSSTVKSTLTALDHIKFLTGSGHPNFLVSAFDINHLSDKSQTDSREVMNQIFTAKGKNKVILIDSGNYEKAWNGKSWPHKSFLKIHKYLPPNLLVFSYDNLKPSTDPNIAINDIIKSYNRDKVSLQLNEGVLPIVHYPTDPMYLPYICKTVVEAIDPPMIAVPERELGEGIYKRCKSIYNIRAALNSTGKYCPIHILGTGNPHSLLMLSACGADSFDGLEWCQSSVDRTTGCLYHSQIADFFIHQSPQIADAEINFTTKTMLHNLHFYIEWMMMIKNGLKQKNMSTILNKYLPSHTYEWLSNELPEVIK